MSKGKKKGPQSEERKQSQETDSDMDRCWNYQNEN